MDWKKRSDLVYAPKNTKTPRVLDEQELAEEDVELTHSIAPSWLKLHKLSTIAVNRKTGVTDPKDPRMNKCLLTELKT